MKTMDELMDEIAEKSGNKNFHHACELYRRNEITSSVLARITKAAAKEYASQEKIAYSNELLGDLLEAFQQACWIEHAGHYDHMGISTWKRIQRTLIEAGKIKAEECYRQV